MSQERMALMAIERDLSASLDMEEAIIDKFSVNYQSHVYTDRRLQLLPSRN